MAKYDDGKLGKLSLPPSITTPKESPWDSVDRLVNSVNELIAVLKAQQGLLPGTPAKEKFYPLVEREVTREVITRDLLRQIYTTIVTGQPSDLSLQGFAVLPFKKSVSASTQDDMDRPLPFSGVVKDVIFSFPAGCQQLVDTRLLYLPKGGSSERIVPSVDDAFIALDDFSAVFTPNFPVVYPGSLRVEWWNYDSLNSHSVVVVATIFPVKLPKP